MPALPRGHHFFTSLRGAPSAFCVIARSAQRDEAIAATSHAQAKRDCFAFARNDGGNGILRAAAQQEALAAAVIVDLQMVLVANAQRVADAAAGLHVEEFVDHAKERRGGLLDQDIAI